MKKSILALVVLSAITAQACADDVTVPAPAAPVSADNATTAAPASARNFIGVDIGSGAGYPDSTGDYVNTLTARGWVAVSATQRIAAGSFGIHGGQWLNDKLGWEIGYEGLDSVAGSAIASTIPNTALGNNYGEYYNYSASAVYAAALGAIKFDSGKLYGKAGLHIASTKTEYYYLKTSSGFIVASGRGTATNSTTGLLLGAGYEYELNKNWAVRADMTMLNGVQFTDANTFMATKSQTMTLAVVGVDYSF